MTKRLDEADCRYAIENGDFPADIREAAPSVAVILTQSWCPQWRSMSTYLEKTDDASTGASAAPPAKAAIYVCEYDREPYFREFMRFKEDVFGNREVPYVRYYRDGKLVDESNYVMKDGFARRLA